MLNQVSLIGHLGRDPEMRRLGNGNPVANFRLATSERWKDKTTGERVEKPEWHSIVCFNENLCRIIEQHLRKGSRVFVQGSLQTRKWQHTDGSDRYSTEIVLSAFNGTVTMLDKVEGRPAQNPEDYGTTTRREGSDASRSSGGAGAGAGGRPTYDLDDDIPF